jgi:hypothetical protein
MPSIAVAAITVASDSAARGAFSSTSNELFGAAAATLAFIKKAIDLNDAAVERRLPCLEFQSTGHSWIAFCPWMDFPMPPRRRVLLNVEINTTMLHDTLLPFR